MKCYWNRGRQTDQNGEPRQRPLHKWRLGLEQRLLHGFVGEMMYYSKKKNDTRISGSVTWKNKTT